MRRLYKRRYLWIEGREGGREREREGGGKKGMKGGREGGKATVVPALPDPCRKAGSEDDPGDHQGQRIPLPPSAPPPQARYF